MRIKLYYRALNASDSPETSKWRTLQYIHKTHLYWMEETTTTGLALSMYFGLCHNVVRYGVTLTICYSQYKCFAKRIGNEYIYKATASYVCSSQLYVLVY